MVSYAAHNTLIPYRSCRESLVVFLRHTTFHAMSQSHVLQPAGTHDTTATRFEIAATGTRNDSQATAGSIIITFYPEHYHGHHGFLCFLWVSRVADIIMAATRASYLAAIMVSTTFPTQWCA